jgi:RimJ/RimL family protein N-acetyltransferase
MKDVPVIALRPVADADLDALFDQMRDPESVWMAAFTPTTRTTGPHSMRTWPR